MPAETHIETNLVVKLEKAERWQEPPVLLREASMPVRNPPARDARQDGRDGRVDGADEHRSGRATYCRTVQ